ncbi:MAG TPA: hypothetical protein PLL17_00935 [Defluviitaleaceae bacterium]|nr:hypothetical protein [Defluviitaleaceae bacterium]HQD49684.1 hypothetical protein [Defluviitaleaceae bacterium]
MYGLKIENLALEKKAGELPGYIHHRISNEVSDFSFFFKDFVERLDDYYWILEKGSTYISWESPEKDDHNFEFGLFKDFYEEVYEEYSVYRMYDNKVFKKYIHYIIDDWNTIFCFKKEKIKLKDFIISINTKRGQDKENFLKENIDFIFLNIDGLFWLFFSNDAFYLNDIRLSLAKFESKVKLTDCCLSDYINMIAFT